MKISILWFTLLFFFIVALSSEATTLENIDDLQKRLSISSEQLYGHKLKELKIAILDNGFQGFAADGEELPQSAELIEGPGVAEAMTSHGTKMAQIIWALLGNKKEGPKFYLINANTYTNFKAAVQKVVELDERVGIDIVLYSQIWETFGNFDGTGFINSEVSKVTDRGIVWVNASGDPHNMVFNGEGSDLPKTVTLRNKLHKNNTTITLSWNDFDDDPSSMTDIDLGFRVIDKATGEALGIPADKVQDGVTKNEENPKYSSFAKEAGTVLLKKSNGSDSKTYAIEVFSSNLTQEELKDVKYRLTIRSDKLETIEFTDSNIGKNEIPIPADHSDVFTVGHFGETSAIGPTMDGREKPDVRIDFEQVLFTTGEPSIGSSVTAAAFVAKLGYNSQVNSDWLNPDFIRNQMDILYQKPEAIFSELQEIESPYLPPQFHAFLDGKKILEAYQNKKTLQLVLKINGKVEDLSVYNQLANGAQGLKLYWNNVRGFIVSSGESSDIYTQIISE